MRSGLVRPCGFVVHSPCPRNARIARSPCDGDREPAAYAVHVRYVAGAAAAVSVGAVRLGDGGRQPGSAAALAALDGDCADDAVRGDAAAHLQPARPERSGGTAASQCATRCAGGPGAGGHAAAGVDLPASPSEFEFGHRNPAAEDDGAAICLAQGPSPGAHGKAGVAARAGPCDNAPVRTSQEHTLIARKPPSDPAKPPAKRRPPKPAPELAEAAKAPGDATATARRR